MAVLKSVVRRWLPLATVTTLLCGLVYGVAQQGWRQAANEPQAGLALDAADRLGRGDEVAAVLPAPPIDVGRSLSPFLIVYGEDQRPIASSGLLHGATPTLPDGVLDTARVRGENRLTWQPEPGVRLAAVVAPVQGEQTGYVLAARSLRDVERHIDEVGFMTGLAWLAALGASLALIVLGEVVLAR